MTAATQTGRQNAIGFLRLLAASLVIIGHSFGLGEFGPDPLASATNNQVAIGRLPVDVFFVLSGYLVTASFLRVGVWRYVSHRTLRIYPAYLACLLLTVMVVAPSANGVVWAIGNAPLIFDANTDLAGTFPANPVPGSVNAALWTLPWEVRAYVIVGVLGVLGLLRRWWVVAILTGGAWVLMAVLIFTNPGTATGPAITSGFRLLTFFGFGSLLYLRPIRYDGRIFALASVTIVAITMAGVLWVPFSGGLFYALCPPLVAYGVLYLGFRLPLTRVNNSSDISYGLYLYGTLVLNLLTAAGLNTVWPIYVGLTFAIAGALAIFSWVLVEHPTLQLKELPHRRAWPIRRSVQG